MLCMCEQATLTVCVCHVLAGVCPCYSYGVYVCKCVSMYFMLCVSCACAVNKEAVERCLSPHDLQALRTLHLPRLMKKLCLNRNRTIMQTKTDKKWLSRSLCCLSLVSQNSHPKHNPSPEVH